MSLKPYKKGKLPYKKKPNRFLKDIDHQKKKTIKKEIIQEALNNEDSDIDDER